MLRSPPSLPFIMAVVSLLSPSPYVKDTGLLSAFGERRWVKQKYFDSRPAVPEQNMTRIPEVTSAAGATAGSHEEHTRRGHQAPTTATLGCPLSASEDGACLVAAREGKEDGDGGGTPERHLSPPSTPRSVTPRHSVADSPGRPTRDTEAITTLVQTPVNATTGHTGNTSRSNHRPAKARRVTFKYPEVLQLLIKYIKEKKPSVDTLDDLIAVRMAYEKDNPCESNTHVTYFEESGLLCIAMIFPATLQYSAL